MRVHPQIGDRLPEWIEEQRVFVVASAPLGRPGSFLLAHRVGENDLFDLTVAVSEDQGRLDLRYEL